MRLNFIEIGNGRPMVILHGLFGSLDNWMTIAKRFSEHYRVFLVDQRNHGRSEHVDEQSYEAMSDDLHLFFVEHNLDDVLLVGHSMGGKTAMQFAINHSDLLRKVVVLDIGPQAYEVHHDEIIRSLQSLDLENISSRKEAELAMENLISQKDTRQFLLKNLYRTSGTEGSNKYAWRFNLDVIARDIEEVGLPIFGSCNLPMLFIRGGRSNYLSVKQTSTLRAQFPNAEMITLETGHWIHAENPEGLFDAIIEFGK
jgi:esterase